jgi:predicted ArsR family transcriptional regulator
MKQLKKELQAISKALGQLTKKTEQMTRRLERLEKRSKAKKPKSARRGPGRPPKKTVGRKSSRKTVTVRRKSSGKTAIDALLKLINRSKKGVRIEELRKKTGIGENNLRVSLYRLKKRGEITNAGKGIYIKA